jgi:hypothetical protein
MMNKVTVLEPTNMTEAMEFSTAMSKSEMVPQAYRGKPQDILVAIQMGYEVGLAPMQALQNIAVISGKPTVWGDALLALCKNHPAWRGMTVQVDGEVATCTVHRELKNGEIETTKSTFSRDDALKAGLLQKNGPWKTYTKRMLGLRARGFALRDAFPDAIKGMITTEEAMDYPKEPEDRHMKTVQGQDIPSTSNTAPAMLEAVSDDPTAIEDVVPNPVLVLNLPGDKTEEFQMQEAWATRYGELLLSMRQYEKLSHAERRTKLKELEHLNLETIEGLDTELRDELKLKRNKYNAQLGIEEKEAGDG